MVLNWFAILFLNNFLGEKGEPYAYEVLQQLQLKGGPPGPQGGPGIPGRPGLEGNGLFMVIRLFM